MTDLTREGLVELANRVEQASGPDRELDGAIEVELRRVRAFEVGLTEKTRAKWQHNRGTVFDGNTGYDAPRFTGALEAGRAIWGKWDHAEVYRPDHETLGWTVHLFENANLSRDQHTGFAATEELAWLAAALYARAMEAGRG